MTTVKASPSAPAIKWALIGTVTSIIITYALQFLNVDPNGATKYLGMLPFIAFLLLAQKEYKDQLGGYMSFGEGFLAGFLYSLFLGLLSAVFIYVYYKFLSPEMLQKILDSTRAELEKKDMSPEQIDKAMEVTSKVFGPVILTIVSFIISLLLGTVVALIGAAVFKKDRPAFMAANDYEAPQHIDPTV
jgi:hypothetical protein